MFAFTIIALTCLFNKHVGGLDLHHHNSRILNGEDAAIKDFPYYAGLGGCGGAILSDSWVVTAAHCIPLQPYGTSKYVYVGGNSLQNSTRIRYDKVIYHPEMNLNSLAINDIALLRLSEPLKFTDKIKPVALPNAPVSLDEKLLFAGRGITEDGHPSASLKMMNVSRLSTEQCLSRMPSYIRRTVRPFVHRLEKAILCAIRVEGTPGMCMGDSGSPLTAGNTLVGLASFIGGASCKESHLGFYVNVESYVPWIKSVTGL